MHVTALICALALFIAPIGVWADDDKQDNSVTLKRISEDLTDPVQVTFAPGDPSKLYVVEREGLVRVLKNGEIIRRALLDIEAIINTRQSAGLVSVAFPPDYATSHKLYANYIDPQGDTIIGRFETKTTETADEDGLAVIMKIAQAFPNSHTHDIRFGPDKLLYITSGDGGGSNNAANVAQRLDSTFGKLLRIDPSPTSKYAVPTDNPFLTHPKALPEIWALGFGNPTHISFDRESRELYLIDSRPKGAAIFIVSKSGNGGWGAPCQDSTCPTNSIQKPIYTHSTQAALIGGAVYRGAAIPQLRGRYVFAEAGTGQLYTLVLSGGVWEHHPLAKSSEKRLPL